MSVPHAQTSTYKTVLRPALFITGLTFFVFLTVQSWQETKVLLQAINWSFFFLSVFAAILDNILLSVLFQNLLTKYEFQLAYAQIGRMFFYGQIAKYIPGRLWNVLYHATFSQRPGVTSAMLFTNLDMMTLGILRTFIIAMALIMFPQQKWVAGGLFVLGAFTFGFLSKSCWIARIFQFLMQRIKQLARNLAPCRAEMQGLPIILIYCTAWITFLTANFLLMKAALGFSWSESALYIAYFGLAWILSVISFIVPAGIGVREITFVFLVRYFGQNLTADAATLTAIAIVYRFWIICLDISGLSVGFLLGNYGKER